MLTTPVTTPCASLFPPAHGPQAELLNEAQSDQVLHFLLGRPVHCAYLSGLITENGLTSPLNRGAFYAYRDYSGEIQGVALIGHATIIESLNDEALKAFADAASTCNNPHLIMCEEGLSDTFLEHYSAAGLSVRQTRRELLFELRWPVGRTHTPQLRLATTEDIEELLPVHASMAYESSGVDPREVDNAGFVKRYERRIQQGKTWVLFEGDRLIFKADVVTETRETTYVEGVWVHPDVRREGYGRKCMAQLARMLLWRSRSICLLVSDENKQAQAFYKACGYHFRGAYRTIFVN
jgi:predicted GNAT family acetyltransferase